MRGSRGSGHCPSNSFIIKTMPMSLVWKFQVSVVTIAMLADVTSFWSWSPTLGHAQLWRSHARSMSFVDNAEAS